MANARVEGKGIRPGESALERNRIYEVSAGACAGFAAGGNGDPELVESLRGILRDPEKSFMHKETARTLLLALIDGMEGREMRTSIMVEKPHGETMEGMCRGAERARKIVAATVGHVAGKLGLGQEWADGLMAKLGIFMLDGEGSRGGMYWEGMISATYSENGEPIVVAHEAVHAMSSALRQRGAGDAYMGIIEEKACIIFTSRILAEMAGLEQGQAGLLEDGYPGIARSTEISFLWSELERAAGGWERLFRIYMGAGGVGFEGLAHKVAAGLYGEEGWGLLEQTDHMGGDIENLSEKLRELRE